MRTDLDLELVRELHPAGSGDDRGFELARGALLADRASVYGARADATTTTTRRLAPVGLAAALAAVAVGIALAISLPAAPRTPHRPPRSSFSARPEWPRRPAVRVSSAPASTGT